MAALIAVLWLRRKTFSLTPLIGGLILFGAFILPVNGFWNYFLPGAVFICTLIPFIVEKITVKIEKTAQLDPLKALNGLVLTRKNSGASQKTIEQKN